MTNTSAPRIVAILRALLALFPKRFHTEFHAEIASHIAAEYDEVKARGPLAVSWFGFTTALDLCWTALRERMNPTFVQSNGTPQPSPHMRSTLSTWFADLAYAARCLRRSPGFAAITIGTLGLAIGANAGMFSVVDKVLLRPLPYVHPERLVSVSATAPGSELKGRFGLSSEFYLQYLERSKLIDGITIYQTGTSTFRVGDRVERVRMAFPTWSLFNTLGAKPFLGRLPTADDKNVIVISYAAWKNWFGSDSSVVGKSYDASYGSRLLIGVMGPDFAFPSNETVVWLSSGEVRAADVRQTGAFGLEAIARMKPGVTTEQLAAELTALAKQVPDRFGGTPNFAKLVSLHRADVRPLAEAQVSGVATPIWILLAAVVVVLLIACANVANLFLVRAEGRQRELAVRRAIGAGRAQLVRLQMAEAVIVALCAAGLALVLAFVILPVFVHAAPAGVPRLNEVRIDLATTLFTLIAAMAAALACGLVPALRGSAPDLTRLRDGGRGSTRGRYWGRDALVAGQTAMALMLLISSGLLLRSFSKLSHVNPGYETKDIFTFQIAPEQSSLTDGPTWARFHLAFMDRLRALPGVTSVGLVENVPLDEGTQSTRYRSEERAGDADAGSLLSYTFAAADYWKTMSIKVIAGRTFNIDDNFTTLGNVVISKSAANALWPGQSAVGHRLRGARDSTWSTVIGVVDDVKQYDFRDQGQSLVYFPMAGPTPASWRLSSPAYVVKTARAETIGEEIRKLVHEVAPEAPMYRAFTMSFLAKRSMTQLSFTMLTLGIAAALALLLGAVGLYGVLSYVVAQRRREIGVRMALGAEAASVRRMVVAQGARVVAVGAAVGIAGAVLSTRALATLLFGVDTLDLATFGITTGAMMAVGLLASYIPARSASSVDPIEALRGD